MKESTWEDCFESISSLSVSKDKAKVKSLMDTADARILFLKDNDIKDTNINFIFEGYYSSILELLHALVLSEGFKVNNHICLGYFLRDVLNRPDLFRIFDDCRYKRNSLIYYGKKMDFEVANSSIQKSFKIINEIKILLEKK